MKPQDSDIFAWYSGEEWKNFLKATEKHVIKIFLSDQYPDPIVNEIKKDVHEISSSGGYHEITVDYLITKSGKQYQVEIENLSIIAGESALDTFNTAILYDETNESKLMYYWSISPLKLLSGESLTLKGLSFTVTIDGDDDEDGDRIPVNPDGERYYTEDEINFVLYGNHCIREVKQ